MGWLVVVLVALASALAVALVAQRRRTSVLQRLLDDAVGAEAVDVIAIQIRNHGEVAASRSAFARPLAVLTPGLLRGIVHRETVKMMRTELAGNGVDADVRLRRLAPHPTVDPADPDLDADDGAGAGDASL